MNATTHTPSIHYKLRPIAGLILLALSALAMPMDVKAQTSSSAPQILSRSRPQNYTVLHVDATNGNDQQGTGDATKPYKTVTQALQIASSGVSTVILLAPGHYSQASGETFPLRLRPGITIQGNAGEARNTMIFGSGEVHTENSLHSATIVTADRSGLANITISNPKGTGVWITTGSPVLRRVALVSNGSTGIHVNNSAPVIENSYFNQNRQGLVIEGTSRAVIRSNYFEATGQAISIASPATPSINNNRIARNDVGIALKNNARPILEANVLDENKRNGVVEVDPVVIEPAPESEQDDLLAVRVTEVSQTTAEIPVVPHQEPAAISTSNTAPTPDTSPVVEQLVSLQILQSTQPATTTNHQEIVPPSGESGMAEDAIPIAVIPVDSSEMALQPVVNNERKAGISKLLTRLSNRQPEAIVEQETPHNPEINTPEINLIEVPSQRLPVPAVAIPSARSSSQLPPPGTISLARAFRYRVLVEMNDADGLNILVPDAFRTQVGNRTFMQAGAYVDEAEAQERLEWLEDHGIDASINVRN